MATFTSETLNSLFSEVRKAHRHMPLNDELFYSSDFISYYLLKEDLLVIMVTDFTAILSIYQKILSSYAFLKSEASSCQGWTRYMYTSNRSVFWLWDPSDTYVTSSETDVQLLQMLINNGTSRRISFIVNNSCSFPIGSFTLSWRKLHQSNECFYQQQHDFITWLSFYFYPQLVDSEW